MSRSGLKITRTEGDFEYASGSAAPRWLEEFASKMDQPRTAVEVSRERIDAPSVVDRINAIMGNGRVSPYSSVEEAVQDYQKRTGLQAYQKMAIAQEIIDAGDEASASDSEKKTSKPELLNTHPEIEVYIRNVIDSQHGIQLPAILHGIMELFGRQGVQEGEVYGHDLCHYINNLLSKVPDKNHSNDLGLGRGTGTEPITYEINDGNRDPFVNLVPRRM